MNIIFDWSGVISDDFHSCYEACMILMNEKIGKTISIEEFKEEFTLPYMNFWAKYVPDMKHDEENKRFSEIIHTVSPATIIPGVKEVLEELKKNHKMVILTSQIGTKLAEEIEEYGLVGIFNETNADVHRKDEAIHAIMERNNFDPKETFYIGDMEHDMDAGKAAGVKRIAITTGYDTKEQLLRRKPEFIIDSMSELPEVLKN